MKLDAAILTDLCRTQLPGYDPWKISDGFVFDAALGLRACEFFQECLTFTTGRWSGRRWSLEPWQAAIVGCVHGWRRVSDGTRRYRRALVTTARKSGKTPLAAGLGLYHLFAEGEPDPSIVCAAGSAEQASIAYNAGAKMVRQEPELSRRAEVMSRAIRHLTNGGSMRFVNSAAATAHGSNESLLCADEVHAMASPDLIDVLETSQRARVSPLSIYTTTAGSDPEGLWAELFDYGRKVIEGSLADPEYLPCMWQAGAEDDIADPATWRKAQPNLNVTVSEEEYRRDLAKALATPRFMGVFRTLSLNRPADHHSAWIPFDVWRKCAGTFEPEPGAACYAGVDLASVHDTAAVVLAFPLGDRVAVRPFVFLPEQNAAGLFTRQKRDKAPYRAWADSGHLTLTPGNVISFDHIAETIIEQARRYDLREVQMDPHAHSAVSTKLMEAGVNVQTVRQGWSLAPAVAEAEKLIHSGRLLHPDSPVLNWQISNAVVHTDRHENSWLDKAKSTRRIDAVAALVMAVNSLAFGAGRCGTSGGSYYAENPEPIFL